MEPVWSGSTKGAAVAGATEKVIASTAPVSVAAAVFNNRRELGLLTLFLFLFIDGADARK
ncbi:hypothetical protein NicSoilE8_00360 [Arthrobacter sp. NicSoilE8]|nr:hypothetical protein NicSoilE8_00360 [Arthrobacter sp. NicSoilE8]